MIGIIVINYRSEEKTIAFVKNEMSKVSSANAVVIVDNGSTDESLSTLLEAFKGWPSQHVFVVPSKENQGFAKGNNLGAEVAMNQFDPDVLLFANNDISLCSDDVVDKMATKLGEYLAAARPVVITDVGEAMNWLEDGKTAYVTPHGDTRALSDAIVKVLSDPEGRERIGLNGRDLALASFDCMAWSKPLSDFISSLGK